jgi:hypothetical protein
MWTVVPCLALLASLAISQSDTTIETPFERSRSRLVPVMANQSEPTLNLAVPKLRGSQGWEVVKRGANYLSGTGLEFM